MVVNEPKNKYTKNKYDLITKGRGQPLPLKNDKDYGTIN